LLDRIDLLIATLPPGDAMRRELLDLRMEISRHEEIFVEARQTIEKLEEVIKKVTSPANRIGTFLGSVGKDTAHIVVGGSDYYCNVDPRIPMAKLKKGTRVLVNEAFVIVGDLGFEPAGPVTKVTEVIGTDRLRVGNDTGRNRWSCSGPHSWPKRREAGRRSPGRFQLSHGAGDNVGARFARTLSR
jgi:proteasome-associated ATPase